jgi:hypothetical protein
MLTTENLRDAYKIVATKHVYKNARIAGVRANRQRKCVFEIRCDKHETNSTVYKNNLITYEQLKCGVPFCKKCSPELECFLEHSAVHTPPIGVTEGSSFRMSILNLCNSYGLQCYLQYPVGFKSGQHQYHASSGKCSDYDFYIDFYFPNLNIAIEFDEKYHCLGDNLVLDAYREDEIRRKISGIEFIRVSEKKFLEDENYFIEHFKTELGRIKAERTEVANHASILKYGKPVELDGFPNGKFE